VIHINMAGYRNAPVPVPPVCPECATTPHTDPAAPHIHVTDFGYVLYTPTRESRTWIEEIRAEGVAAGRKQAAADVDAWANELAARTTRNSGQHETYACGKQMLVLTGHEANEGIVAATRKAARIAEGGEPNAG
jgi:hypothetical protein